jgi:hypothetical protein
MALFPCPYLHSEVEWTEERERHATEQHPDLLPEHRDKIGQTLLDPDQVRPSTRFAGARLFSRWYADVRDGKHVVVVIVSDHDQMTRHWIITAYITRRLAQGEAEWKRS